MSETPTVSALFVESDGIYFGRPNVDPWDIRRDARNYNEWNPVVAHPPCRLWVNMAAVNWKRYRRERPAWYPGGTDGGCFAAALAAVRRCGGVLEQPAYSWAWDHFGLTAPYHTERWTPAWGTKGAPDYWICEVWQSAYGHAARKRTWLLYVGDRPPPELDWSREPGTHQVGWFDRIKPTLSKKAASATPPAFAAMLLRLAASAAPTRHLTKAFAL